MREESRPWQEEDEVQIRTNIKAGEDSGGYLGSGNAAGNPPATQGGGMSLSGG